jgi:hypothetical protein
LNLYSKLKSTCDVNLLSKLSIIFKEWRVMNRWILIRHLKQILEYLTISYGNTIIINLLMGGF